MESNLTIPNIAALFGAMVVLAAIPGPSVFAVVARALASGFTHGFVTVIGIVAGDFVFILLAIGGLSAIAETMGVLFDLMKYLGSAYLIWLGIGLWRSQPKNLKVEGIQEYSWWSNFLCGLLITLGDPKAIFFYISFFPAFVKLANISALDISIILTTTMMAVGGVKLVYAYMADKTRLLFKNSRAKKAMNMTAGSVMLGTGVFLLVKT